MYRGRLLILFAIVVAMTASCSDGKAQRLAADQEDATTTTTEATTTTAVVVETTSTTAAPSTTTAKPTTTTTAKPTTTTTTIPKDQAALTIVNEYPAAVVATVNGVRYEVAKGGRKGPVAVKPRAIQGNDTITIERADDKTCGTGGADGYFEPGGSYTLRLYVSTPGSCGQNDYPGLAGQVNPGGRSV